MRAITTQCDGILPLGCGPACIRSTCSSATRLWLAASRATTGPSSRCWFEIWKSRAPCGARRETYSDSASLVMRCIGMASELKASSTMRSYDCDGARCRDSRASPSTTRQALPQSFR